MFFHTVNTAYGEIFSIEAAQRVVPPGGGKTSATSAVTALGALPEFRDTFHRRRTKSPVGVFNVSVSI